MVRRCGWWVAVVLGGSVGCGSPEGNAGSGAAAGGAGGGAPCSGAAPGAAPAEHYADDRLFSVMSQIGYADAPGKHGQSEWFEGKLLLGTSGGLHLFELDPLRGPVRVGSVAQLMPEHCSLVWTPGFPAARTLFTVGLGGPLAWDLADAALPELRHELAVSGAGNQEYQDRAESFTVQPPWVFYPLSVGGIAVLDASDPAAPSRVGTITPADAGLAMTGDALVVGNLLVTSCHSCAGVALIDVGDPRSPRRLWSSEDLRLFGYGLTINGPRVYRATKGESGLGVGVQVLDISDPTAPTFGVHLRAGDGGDHDGGYLAVQDGAIHFGASMHGYRQWDAATYAELGRLDGTSVPGGDDPDYATAFGNLIALSDDDAFLTTLFPFRADADVTAPVVNLVVPADGATGQPVTSRVGVTLTDWIDPRSLCPETFAVELDGSPVPGRLATQGGIVNFTPASLLAPGRTYRVVVRGLRDHAGNPSPEFSASFTTAP